MLVAVGASALAALYLWLKPAAAPAPSPLAAPFSPAQPAPAAATPYEFRVEHGRRVAGPERIEVHAGDLVRLHITSDAADEVHVHGYDLHTELRPGVASELAFHADRSGRFDIELHHADVQLATLEVQPR